MNKNVQQNSEQKKRIKLFSGEKNRKPMRRPPVHNDIVKDNDIVRIKGGMDRMFLILVIVLICFGSVMVFSASYPYARESKQNSYYFIQRQITFASAGMAIMLLTSYVLDYRWLKKVTNVIFAGVCVLLIAVLFIGQAEGEARRWLSIPGTGIGVQPSEMMKLGLVLMLAKYFSDSEKYLFRAKTKWEPIIRRLGIPFAIVVGVCLLVALERHFSGVIILFLIGACMIFIAGGQLKWLLGAAGSFVVLLLGVIMLVPYARGRIDVWLHPENYSTQGEVWQTLQGLNAVGSGGFFGVGLGQSLQKHMFVSQPQNDFIFAIICEELGFVGAVATICLFIVFVWRGITISQKAPDTFSKFVVVGIVSKVAIQAVLNMAVVTNVIPNTGISLPFFSYGGSSLMMLLLEMGIILAISRYSYQEK